MTIHIEIGKGYKKEFYVLRIGDVEGSISSGNISLEELLEEVRNVCTIMMKGEK